MYLFIKASSSNIENVVEPPTLSQLSDNISEFHQDKMNVIISEVDPSGCNLGTMEGTERDQNIDNLRLKKSILWRYIQCSGSIDNKESE